MSGGGAAAAAAARMTPLADTGGSSTLDMSADAARHIDFGSPEFAPASLTLSWREEPLGVEYPITPAEYITLTKYLSAVPVYYGGVLDRAAGRVLTELDPVLSPSQKRALSDCKRADGDFNGPIRAVDFAEFDAILASLDTLKARAGKPALEFPVYQPFSKFTSPFALERKPDGRVFGVKPEVGKKEFYTDFKRGEIYFGVNGRVCEGEHETFIKDWFKHAFSWSNPSWEADLNFLVSIYRQESQNAALLPLTSVPPFNFTNESYLEGLEGYKKKIRLQRMETGQYRLTISHHIHSASSVIEPDGANPVDYRMTQTYVTAPDGLELREVSIAGADAEIINMFFKKNLAIISRVEASEEGGLQRKLKDILANQHLLHTAIKDRTVYLRSLTSSLTGQMRLTGQMLLLKQVSLVYFLPEDIGRLRVHGVKNLVDSLGCKDQFGPVLKLARPVFMRPAGYPLYEEEQVILKILLAKYKDNFHAKIKDIAYAIVTCFGEKSPRFAEALKLIYANGRDKIANDGSMEYLLYNQFPREVRSSYLIFTAKEKPGIIHEVLAILNEGRHKPVAVVSAGGAGVPTLSL